MSQGGERCPLCKGSLDPGTRVCTVCGIKDEGGQEASEIKTEDDALTKWLSGDMDSISKWIDREARRRTRARPHPLRRPSNRVTPRAGGVRQDIDILKKWFTGNEDSAIEKCSSPRTQMFRSPSTSSPLHRRMTRPRPAREVLTREAG